MPQFVVPPEGISFKDVITDFEKRLIESTLEAAGGVQKRAAELLHIKPTTLNEMIKRYDIRPRRKRPRERRRRTWPAREPARRAGSPVPKSPLAPPGARRVNRGEVLATCRSVSSGEAESSLNRCEA